MDKSRSRPLRTFVYRTLAIRLGAVTLALSLVVLAFTYVQQRDIFERQLADVLQTELALLMNRASGIASERGLSLVDAVVLAVEERRRVPADHVFGRFVYVRLSKPGIPRSLIAGDDDYALIGAAKQALGDAPPDPPVQGTSSELIELAGVPHVRMLAPIRDRDGHVMGQVEMILAVSHQAVRAASAAAFKSIAIAIGIVLATAALLYPVILRLVRRLANFSEALLEANFAALSMLGGLIAMRDSDTDTHNFRVSLYALRLGEAVGLPPEQMQVLLKGAFLHDVGKIGIRDDVLLKPGPLTEQEFAVMRRHVDYGTNLVQRSAWFADAAAVVGGHHEKIDGSGYPKGLHGSDIPVTARIFAIVDVFDALTSRRPYKGPLTFEESVAILEKGRGCHFDAKLLDAFLTIARGLYQRYAGREDEGIKRELEATARPYFRAGLDSLAY